MNQRANKLPRLPRAEFAAAHNMKQNGASFCRSAGRGILGIALCFESSGDKTRGYCHLRACFNKSGVFAAHCRQTTYDERRAKRENKT
jgi:hypothetical protein